MDAPIERLSPTAGSTGPMPRPRPGIMALKPYVGGESKADGSDRLIRLASNEGALGPSPKASAALQAMAGDLHRYPDGGSTDIRVALGSLHGIDPAQIVLGAGSDELISLLMMAYAGPGDRVVHAAHGFAMYPITARSVGAEPISVPEQNLTADVDALIAAVDERVKLVFIANPNNPTGTYLPHREIERLHAALPSGTILVLDAAYAEYAEPACAPGYEDGASLVGTADNVVMLRTFSKIYALGGLRLGWCYAPPGIADVLNRVRGPFNVNAAAQAAGLASLEDRPFIERSIMHNRRWLDEARVALGRIGMETPESHGNFLIPDLGSRAAAEAMVAALKREGILVRSIAGYGLPTRIRFSIGTDEEMPYVLEAMARHWESIRASNTLSAAAG